MTNGESAHERPPDATLQDYALGKLDPTRAKEVETYLNTDAEARATVDSLRVEAEEIRTLLRDNGGRSDSQDIPTDGALARLMDGSVSDEQREALIEQVAASKDTRERLAEFARDYRAIHSGEQIPDAVSLTYDEIDDFDDYVSAEMFAYNPNVSRVFFAIGLVSACLTALSAAILDSAAAPLLLEAGFLATAVFLASGYRCSGAIYPDRATILDLWLPLLILVTVWVAGIALAWFVPSLAGSGLFVARCFAVIIGLAIGLEISLESVPLNSEYEVTDKKEGDPPKTAESGHRDI